MGHSRCSGRRGRLRFIQSSGNQRILSRWLPGFHPVGQARAPPHSFLSAPARRHARLEPALAACLAGAKSAQWNSVTSGRITKSAVAQTNCSGAGGRWCCCAGSCPGRWRNWVSSKAGMSTAITKSAPRSRQASTGTRKGPPPSQIIRPSVPRGGKTAGDGAAGVDPVHDRTVGVDHLLAGDQVQGHGGEGNLQFLEPHGAEELGQRAAQFVFVLLLAWVTVLTAIILRCMKSNTPVSRLWGSWASSRRSGHEGGPVGGEILVVDVGLQPAPDLAGSGSWA